MYEHSDEPLSYKGLNVITLTGNIPFSTYRDAFVSIIPQLLWCLSLLPISASNNNIFEMVLIPNIGFILSTII